MASRRRSDSELPNAPLELLHPLLLPGAEVPGAEIVSEMGCTSDATTLLQLYRAVLAWSAHPENSPAFDRGALERTEYALLSRGPDALASPAGLLAGYMARAETATQREVAWACICIADWATERGARGTALRFTEAAALAWPRHARYAWLVARLLKARGDLRAAETWFRRSHRLAVWTDDWEAQASTLAGLGNLSYTIGNYPRADARLTRALRVARRHKLTRLEAETLHDLFIVAFVRGDAVRAETYGAEALASYRKLQHHRLPALAFDFAMFWVVAGNFRSVLPLLRGLQKCFTEPVKRLQVLAATARAAGACGEAGDFERSWAAASELECQVRDAPAYAACLVDLGLGAASMLRWDDARTALSKSLATAQAGGESDLVLIAEAALDAVTRNERAEAYAGLDGREEERQNSLVAAMLAALHAPAPPETDQRLEDPLTLTFRDLRAA
ncbi:MAG TPA: hypothetical protein VFS20_20170 [Longimicrobium sp.]|nr:hypothetical protein [Longimicrobium sp.]